MDDNDKNNRASVNLMSTEATERPDLLQFHRIEERLPATWHAKVPGGWIVSLKEPSRGLELIFEADPESKGTTQAPPT